MPFFKPLLIVLAAGGAAFVLSGGRADAQGTTLHGTVGPAFNISLVDASGNAVTHLEKGTYTIVVHDRPALHNFHLGSNTDPTVDFRTGSSSSVTRRSP